MDALIPLDYKAPESVEELLRRYATGERYFASADIPDGADLKGAVLEDAILEHVWLSDANCQGANLQRVSFRHSNVKCAIFRDANLQDASFEGAAVEATDFAGANLSGVSFAGAGDYGYIIQPGESPVDEWPYDKQSQNASCSMAPPCFSASSEAARPGVAGEIWRWTIRRQQGLRAG